MKQPAAEGHIEAAGTAFFYRAIGAGPSLVVLHGGPGLGHGYLRPALDRLADEFRVIYWDQRGSGRTPLGEPGAERLNLAGAVDDLRAVIDGLGIERANLVGHSYGADLAVLFAARHPERVGSMVLANPGPPLDPDSAAEMSRAMGRRRLPADAAALERIASSEPFDRREPAAVEDFIRHVYLPFFNDRLVGLATAYDFSDAAAAQVVEAEETYFSDEAFIADSLAALPEIAAPTLIAYGDTDPIPASYSQLLAERIPGARFERLAGASHFAYLENAAQLFGVVVPFLRAHAV